MRRWASSSSPRMMVGLVIFSENGELISRYSTTPTSMCELIHMYETATGKQVHHDADLCNNDKQQMVMRLNELQQNNQRVEAMLNTRMGENLSSIDSMDLTRLRRSTSRRSVKSTQERLTC